MRGQLYMLEAIVHNISHLELFQSNFFIYQKIYSYGWSFKSKNVYNTFNVLDEMNVLTFHMFRLIKSLKFRIIQLVCLLVKEGTWTKSNCLNDDNLPTWPAKQLVVFFQFKVWKEILSFPFPFLLFTLLLFSLLVHCCES